MARRIIGYLILAILAIGWMMQINSKQWSDAYQAKPHLYDGRDGGAL